MNTTLTPETHAALWEQYLIEKRLEIGFFAPSRWNDGKPRTFRQFALEQLEAK